MTYPNSSPIRRSSRGTRGFRPGRANNNAANDDADFDYDLPFEDHWPNEPWPDLPGQPEPDTGRKPLPFPDNDPRDRRKLVRYHLRRGGNLLRGFGFAGYAFGVWEAGKYFHDVYRQKNPYNYPAPYPERGHVTHAWTCPKTQDGYRVFWKPHANWNDGLTCLTAQAQFAAAGSVVVEGTPGTGSIYNYAGDGVPFAVHGANGTYHMILWNQYCVGVGCATSRSQEIAHRGLSYSLGDPYRLWSGSPWWMPAVEPLVSPAVNPHALPINVPVTRPNPMPYRSVPYMPVFDPYAPGTTPLRGPLPARAISPSPWRNGIVVRPGKPTKPAPEHVRRPPVRGERERKPGPEVKRAIDKIVGPTTEAVDAIAAVYDALPWSVRKQAYRECLAGGGTGRECMTPQRKLEVVYENYDRLDMQKVVENLAKNEIEDRLIGELSRRAEKNLRDRGWHDRFGRGPTTGPAL